MVPATVSLDAPLPTDADFAEVQRLALLPRAASEALLQEAIRRAEAKRLPWHLAFAQVGLANALCVSDPVAAQALAQTGLDAMRALGSLRGQAEALNAIALACRERGTLAECLAALEQVLLIERSLDHGAGVVRVLTNMSTILEHVGRRGAALQCLEEALDLVPDPEDRRRVRIQNNLSAALASWARHERDEGLPPEIWRPRAQRAVLLARTLMAMPAAELVSAMKSMHYPRGCLAKALVVLDELDEALSLLQPLRVIYAEQGDTYALLYVQLELARAWVQGGQPEQARQLVQQTIDLAAQRRFDHFLDDLYLVLSQANAAVGDFREALSAFQTHHRLKLRGLVDRAEDQARMLAVKLDTARALRESRRDPLTGLRNRRGFDEALKAALAQVAEEHPISLLVIDLDHFKAVNDRDGHLRGDQALELVAMTLLHSCRALDTAARLGGDEFALLGMMDTDNALQVAGRLRDALRAQSASRWPDRPPLTLSIGITTIRSAIPVDGLMQRADDALYQAKAAGRDGAHTG